MKSFGPGATQTQRMAHALGCPISPPTLRYRCGRTALSIGTPVPGRQLQLMPTWCTAATEDASRLTASRYAPHGVKCIGTPCLGLRQFSPIASAYSSLEVNGCSRMSALDTATPSQMIETHASVSTSLPRLMGAHGSCYGQSHGRMCMLSTIRDSFVSTVRQLAITFPLSSI